MVEETMSPDPAAAAAALADPPTGSEHTTNLPPGGGSSSSSSVHAAHHSNATAQQQPQQQQQQLGGGGGAGGSEKWIWVLDPMTRKLRVPLSYLAPTQATATMGTVPSLCIAFLEGRCRHPWCRQAHVLPSMIAQLRHDALNAPTCCSRHQDPHDTSMLTRRFQTITVADCSMQTPIPTECIALTVGLQRYLAHSVPSEVQGPNLEIPSKLICRLHLSHRCRYLEDCNNVHVCREFDLRLHPPPFMMGPLQNLTVTTRTLTLGDMAYTVTPLAVGEVSDDEFHAMCEQQQAKQQQQQHNAAAAGCGSFVGGTSPLNLSTTNSPLLCGVPYPTQLHGSSQGDGSTPHPKQAGGTHPYGAATTPSGSSPFLGSSSSPGGASGPVAAHNNAAGVVSAMLGSLSHSFSTPPLAPQHHHHHAVGPHSNMTMSNPPSGLPSFIPGGGDSSPVGLPPAYGAAAASDGIGASGNSPLNSSTGGGAQAHNHKQQHSAAKSLRVYDIRGLAGGSPTPGAAAPPHQHGQGHGYGNQNHHHFPGVAQNYHPHQHHYSGGGFRHHTAVGGNGSSSSGPPSSQSSPALDAAAHPYHHMN